MRYLLLIVLLFSSAAAQAATVVEDNRYVDRRYIDPDGNNFYNQTRAEDENYGGEFTAGSPQPRFGRYADSYQDSLAYGQLADGNMGFYAVGSGFNLGLSDETEKGSSVFNVELSFAVDTNLTLESLIHGGLGQYNNAVSVSVYDVTGSESLYHFNLFDKDNPVAIDDGLNTYTGYTDTFTALLLAGHTYRIKASTNVMSEHSLFLPGTGYDITGTLTAAAVPIPAAAWLFGSALAGLGWLRRRQSV